MTIKEITTTVLRTDDGTEFPLDQRAKAEAYEAACTLHRQILQDLFVGAGAAFKGPTDLVPFLQTNRDLVLTILHADEGINPRLSNEWLADVAFASSHVKDIIREWCPMVRED